MLEEYKKAMLSHKETQESLHNLSQFSHNLNQLNNGHLAFEIVMGR